MNCNVSQTERNNRYSTHFSVPAILIAMDWILEKANLAVATEKFRGNMSHFYQYFSVSLRPGEMLPLCGRFIDDTLHRYQSNLLLILAKNAKHRANIKNSFTTQDFCLYKLSVQVFASFFCTEYDTSATDLFCRFLVPNFRSSVSQQILTNICFVAAVFFCQYLSYPFPRIQFFCRCLLLYKWRYLRGCFSSSLQRVLFIFISFFSHEAFLLLDMRA